MNLYYIVFSPTGGTKNVLEAVGSAWEDPGILIDLTLPHQDFSRFSFQKDDVCLVAVPSFGGRVPGPAAERIRQLSGQGAAAVPIAVYGNRAYDDTLLELRDLLNGQGFFCAAAVAGIAEHSIMRQFAAGRPDEADRSQLMAFGQAIRLRLSQGWDIQKDVPVSVPGTFPYLVHKGGALIPEPDSRCVRCGQCAALCPAAAIAPDDPFRIDRDACISCMRCVSVCPIHSRRPDPAKVAATTERLKEFLIQPKENECFLSR